MNLTKKQLEFWTIALLFCIGISVLILLVDFGIKAAILEESTRLRIKIEEWESGRGPAKANASGVGNDTSIDSDIPGPLLVEHTPGMEKGGSANGDSAETTPTEKRRRAQPRRSSNT